MNYIQQRHSVINIQIPTKIKLQIQKQHEQHNSNTTGENEISDIVDSFIFHRIAEEWSPTEYFFGRFAKLCIQSLRKCVL